MVDRGHRHHLNEPHPPQKGLVMHLVGDFTWGNVITILITVISAAYAGGKLTQILKTLVDKVAAIEGDFETHLKAFRQHEKDEWDAFGKIHEQLIELALRTVKLPGEDK